MTSRSRRKHQTTAPNTTRAKATKHWIALLGGPALFASSLLSSSGMLSAAETLEWRSRRVGSHAAAPAATAPTPARAITPVAATQPVELALNAPTNGQEEAPAARTAPAPLPAAAAAQARPVTVSRPLELPSERTASLPAGKPLVWGSSSVPAQAAPSQTASAQTANLPAGANRPARIGEIAPASAEVTQAVAEPVKVDPFADPFEDTAVAAAPVVIEAEEPAQAASSNVRLAQLERDDFGDSDGPGLGGDFNSGSQYGDDTDAPPYYEEETEELPPLPPAGGGFQPTVPEPLAPQRAQPFQPRAGAQPCDEVYNNRDTCADSMACDTAWGIFHDRTISQISLDITPHYPTDINNPGATDELRRRQLGELAPREWHNREGELLATGRLQNFYDSLVIVQTPQGTQEIDFRTLGNDELAYLNAWWSVPAECRIEGGIYDHHEAYDVRPWTEMITFTWKSSALCHKPTYFEEIQVERYGHARGPIVQPLMSGAHFFVNLAIVPYHMGINPPNECQYALGYYRPGSCAPWLIEPFPISPRGALYQAAVVTGAAIIIP